jgi:hypothetical protein
MGASTTTRSNQTKRQPLGLRNTAPMVLQRSPASSGLSAVAVTCQRMLGAQMVSERCWGGEVR